MTNQDVPFDESRAEKIFAEHMTRQEHGEHENFESVCLAHADVAPALRRLKSEWEALSALWAPPMDSLVDGTGGREREAIHDSVRQALGQLRSRGAGSSRYKLLGEVGRGSMGVVLRIFDEDLQRTLAMKVVRGAEGNSPPRRASVVRPPSLGRFLAEAQVTGQLDHPGIAPVHELGLDTEGRVYFTMKLVQGRDLKHIFDLVFEGQEGWNETRALSVMLKVCEAMAYAHTKGVIHRDLKPANVMVGGFGEVYVMDWGLARVLGRKDTHDIRLRPESESSRTSLETERRDARGDARDSPLMTVDGDVVGTPAYMPPEQARGEIENLSARSDVYALGAMLYHLLARQAPYVPPRAKLNARAVLVSVVEAEPERLHELRKEIPAELVAICEKAMSRYASDRYPDMLALAEDLRAYLEHRVVGAYETGAVAELKKWVVRNKALAIASAAAVMLLIVGLVVSSTLYATADENARIAKQNEERAVLQERFATQRANDVLSLSASKDLDDLVARADKLWPAHPERIGDYERWLADARELIDGRAADPARGLKARPSLAQHQSKLAEIRAQALAQTDEERRAEHEAHPRYAELLATQAELTWRSRMLGLEPWPSETEVEAALASESLPSDASALNALTWPLVDPENPAYGSEVKALLVARHAIAAAADGERATMHDSLAWAFFRLGRFDDAVSESRRALDEVDDSKKVEFEGYVTKIDKAIGSWRGEELAKRREGRDALVTEVAELERVVGERRTWEFADPEAGWWQVQLSKLVSSLEALRDPVRGLMGDNVAEPYGWGVTKRYEFARTIRERSIDGRDAKARWDDAIAEIAASAKYGGLRLVPQLGLLPIGADPESGLWEFAHLQTGDAAVRGADGKLTVTEQTGLVFVLIPGGAFWMGAQITDSTGRNYDPQAAANESPVHEVTVSPYFLSKYEMTQGQWLRISARNPSGYGPSNNFNGRPRDLTHPVESVSWTEGMELMERLQLLLPSEAQWENGCRAGTTTPWWTGAERESLRRKVNLADQTAKRAGATWSEINDWPDLEDGWAVHAPVGSLSANVYGLHEVHGNVGEWCRDGNDNYSAARQLDPLTAWNGASFRVFRGGSFPYAASFARSAYRNSSTPGYRSTFLGLRAARSVSIL